MITEDTARENRVSRAVSSVSMYALQGAEEMDGSTAFANTARCAGRREQDNIVNIALLSSWLAGTVKGWRGLRGKITESLGNLGGRVSAIGKGENGNKHRDRVAPHFAQLLIFESRRGRALGGPRTTRRATFRLFCVTAALRFLGSRTDTLRETLIPHTLLP